MKNDLEEEFKKGEEKKSCIGRSAIVSRKEKKNLKDWKWNLVDLENVKRVSNMSDKDYEYRIW